MKKIIESCRSENSIIDRYLAYDRSFTLKDFGDEILERVEKNNEVIPIQVDEDFKEILTNYLKEYLGEAERNETMQVIEYKAMSTADHMGGIFSPQSFQGDIFYSWLMRKKGIGKRYIPIWAFGQIPFRNSANPKGMIVFEDQKEPLYLNLVPRKYEDTLVCCAKPYTKEMVLNLRKQVEKAEVSRAVKELLLDLTDQVYGNEGAFVWRDFSQQMLFVGREISKRLFPEEEFEFLYLNGEEIFKELAIADLKNPDSFFYQLLFDEKSRELLNESYLGDEEHSLSCQIFWGIDSKARKYPLRFTRDAMLVGRQMSGESVCMEGDADSLILLLREGKIIPAIYSMICISSFARGYTWNGGIFQGQYLAEYQTRTIDLLKRLGTERSAHYASILEAYDFHGYLSGPVFLPIVGPIELLRHPITLEELDAYMDTSIYDAHIYGMYEFYNDLIDRKSKEENWYEKISLYFKHNGAGATK